MSHKRIFVGVGILISACLAAGCGQTGGDAGANVSATPVSSPGATGAAGGVAVVDLDEVSRRLGRDVHFKQQIERLQGQANDELNTLRIHAESRLQEAKWEAGERPAPEQQQQLARMQQQINNELKAARQKKLTEINEFKQSLIQRFREEARPLAREIAASRGLGVVITRNDASQLVVDPRCDLTDELAERMMQRETVAERASGARNR